MIENFGDFCASDVDLRPFWVPKRVSGGSSGRVFRPFFPDAALHRFFVVFSVKNVKLEKMKKCVSICKLHTILEVAPSKKIRCLREKTLSIQARFSVKNRAKIGAESDSKWQRQEKPTKTASGAVSGRTFSSPDSKKSQNRGLRLPKILLKTLQDGPFWGGSQNDLPKIVLKTLQDGPFWGGSQKTEGVGWPRDAYFGVGCKKWKASGGLETPRNAIFDCPPLPHASKGELPSWG